MRRAGNLVLYNGKNKPLWSSNTGGDAKGRPMTFQVQNDRNMVVYAGTQPLWSSKTYFNPNSTCVFHPRYLYLDV